MEKEEKKTLVQAGVNVTDRVFAPDEVSEWVGAWYIVGSYKYVVYCVN